MDKVALCDVAIGDVAVGDVAFGVVAFDNIPFCRFEMKAKKSVISHIDN